MLGHKLGDGALSAAVRFTHTAAGYAAWRAAEALWLASTARQERKAARR